MQTENSIAYDYLLKLIVIGDTGVGKSCAVLQFVEKRINAEHEATIGVEFAAKTITVQNKCVKLQIWDTAGQENFRSITRSYYRSAIGSLLIYDITRRDTFVNVQDWLQEMKQNGNPSMDVLLVGNKTDLEAERQVTTEQGRNFARKQKLQFVEMSSKQFKKVEGAFTLLVDSIIKKISAGQINEQTPGLKISDTVKNIMELKVVQKSRAKRLCCS